MPTAKQRASIANNTCFALWILGVGLRFLDLITVKQATCIFALGCALLLYELYEDVWGARREKRAAVLQQRSGV